jgi:hypothetical protein
MEEVKKGESKKIIWGVLIIGGAIFSGWLLKDHPEIFESVIDTIKQMAGYVFAI